MTENSNLKHAVKHMISIEEEFFLESEIEKIAQQFGVCKAKLAEALLTEKEAVSHQRALKTCEEMQEKGMTIDVMTSSVDGDPVIDILLKEPVEQCWTRLWPRNNVASSW